MPDSKQPGTRASAGEPREAGSSSAPKDSKTYGRLAKRISSWTSNLLATVLVVLICLGVGKWVLEWDDAPPSPSAQPGQAASFQAASFLLDAPQELQFGDDAQSIERSAVEGDRAAAEKALLASCRQIAQQSPFPTGPQIDAERRLLEETTRHSPTESRPGAWQLFALEGSFPIVAAVRLAPDSADDDVAAPARRMVAWGLAAPTAKRRWTLYVCRLAPAEGTAGQRFEVALPEGARRTLTLRGREGSVTGFAGRPTDPAAWQRHFDGWFAKRGLVAMAVGGAPWSRWHGVWHARYLGRHTQAGASLDVQVDVQFAPNGESWIGLVNVSQTLSPEDPGRRN
ncbi:MAG: hypothetical protein HYS13_03930 [Planctomycetia bacterium]|nr:hypothetical protein [Planctomycetia bacterium]